MTASADNAENNLESSNGSNPVMRAVRSVLLAAIGTVAIGKEEAEAIVGRLVEKGEIAEQDGRELLNDLYSRRRRDLDRTQEMVGDRVGTLDQRIETVLNRMNIPSKSDVESLSRKVSTLSDKVDDLNQKIGE